MLGVSCWVNENYQQFCLGRKENFIYCMLGVSCWVNEKYQQFCLGRKENFILLDN